MAVWNLPFFLISNVQFLFFPANSVHFLLFILVYLYHAPGRIKGGQTTICPREFIPDDLLKSLPAQWFFENMNFKKSSYKSKILACDFMGLERGSIKKSSHAIKTSRVYSCRENRISGNMTASRTVQRLYIQGCFRYSPLWSFPFKARLKYKYLNQNYNHNHSDKFSLRKLFLKRTSLKQTQIS